MKEFLEEWVFSDDNEEIMRLGEQSLGVGNVINASHDKVIQLRCEKLHFEYVYIGYGQKLERYEYEMYFL